MRLGAKARAGQGIRLDIARGTWACLFTRFHDDRFLPGLVRKEAFVSFSYRGEVEQSVRDEFRHPVRRRTTSVRIANASRRSGGMDSPEARGV
jgi:hypothetical protein